jgi:hypothetical protein
MSRLGSSSTFAALTGAAFLLLSAPASAASRSSSHVSSSSSSSHSSPSHSSGSHRSSGSHSSSHGGSWNGGHGGGSWGGGHHHGGWGYYGGSGFYGSGWGWGWGFGPWWGYGYPYYSGYDGYPYRYGYGPGYYAGYGGGQGDPRARFATVKTDVEPDEAALYLDGKLIGTADDFDGFPDKLYLGRGHYRLEFRLDGYETLTTDIDASPGRFFRIDQHLKKIPGAAHYGTYTPAQPEGGVIRYFEKNGSHASPADSDWRSRGGRRHPPEATDDEPAPRQRMTYEGDADSAAPDYDDDDASGASDADDDRDDDRRPPAATEPAPPATPSMAENDSRIVFDVSPPDAAIYVDDRFAGSARELNGLAGGMAVSSGEHRITVTCPGYREATVRLESSGAKRAKARIELKR